MWKPLGLLKILIMLLFLQYHVAVSSPAAPTSQHLSLSMQKVALFQFKLSLIYTSASAACTSYGSYPKMMNWSMSSDCCMWNGVTCDLMKRNVIGLDLTCSQLEGVIPPNSTLFQLSTLQFIYFNGNNLHGVLPDSIANLKSLTTLSLPDCNFSGPIPRTLGNLTKLTYLNLDFNHITGPIPYSLANIQSLEYLFLRNNSLIGQFSLFDNCRHLVSLDLSDNLLSGHLPSKLTALNLTRLFSLDLANNLLDGMIPSWLFDLPSLRYLYVDYNGFIGQIHEFNSSRSSLEHFSCRENMLNGTIPQSFSKLVNLTRLNLADNQFGGEIPQWNGLILKGSSFYLNLSHNSLTGGLEHLPWDNLFILDLHSNMLNGSMPASISNSSSLCILNLSHNNLSGVLPSFPRNVSHLKYLDLQSNMLNGSLPAFICNASVLQILNLSYNNFSGVFPTCPGSVNYSLLVLDLRMNSIRGSLPSSLANFGKLRTLNLNGNKLEGTIPVSFAKFSYLEVLDIGSNQIRDTFPHCLESLPTLQVLVLKSNKFHGFISNNSKIARPFPSLRIIDLSYNEFSGPLPAKFIRNFSAMMNGNVHKVTLGYMGYASYSDSITVVIKGVEIELVRILTAFTTIDFSQNKFEGEIPEYIGNLKSLRYLNLSHNYLTGHIPSLIGKLSVLESLDLSFNRLDGVIPQQLTNIFSLSHINLSQNKLSGRIPEGAQFHTFENDSYAGNLGLCGRPLSKKCITEKREEEEEEDDDDDEYFFSGLTWKAMVLGYECGMVLGFIAGYLMFMAKKPKWLTRIVAREPGLIVRGMEIRRR